MRRARSFNVYNGAKVQNIFKNKNSLINKDCINFDKNYTLI